ncbi:hypothetical protein [Streptomyces marianii]|uniref:hypothetical protein n=1 Tax=Streptomyces marianii TaxID=1817406 RepID=UPI0018F8C832|nr:hypothetical protein [Streptomyces marianii]
MAMDLGLVDVEWADGEGGRLRKSVLEAVSRVRFESVLPVRRFTSYRGQRHFTGWYWAAGLWRPSRSFRPPRTPVRNTAATGGPAAGGRHSLTGSAGCIALGPVHNETLGSYLHRLAVANNRPAGFLARLLGPLPPEFSPLSNTTAGWNPHSPGRLAILSGRPTPQLASARPHSPTSSARGVPGSERNG